MISILFSVLLCYAVFSLYLFNKKNFQYTTYSTLLRKGLYTILILSLLIGFLTKEINYDDWQSLLKLLAIFIFVDLTIFQTPSITKFGTAEFKHGDEIRENTIKNEKRIKHMNKKASVFSIIVQEIEVSLYDFTSEAYVKKLTEFVERYTKEFDFSIKIYPIIQTPHAIEEKNDIEQSLSKMENTFNITFDKKSDIQEQLFNAQVYSFNDSRHAVIPIYGEKHSVLILISANQEGIIEIDTTNIINLATIFNWEV